MLYNQRKVKWLTFKFQVKIHTDEINKAEEYFSDEPQEDGMEMMSISLLYLKLVQKDMNKLKD